MNKYKQFIVWRAEPRENGKVDKIPINPINKKPIDAHDPTNWRYDYEAEALRDRCGNGYGVGFVFTENDPYNFFDIDNCLVDGIPNPFAVEVMTTLKGAAVGVSQSGRGLHIICSGAAPENRAIQSKDPPIDLYTEKRFVALSGNGFTGDFDADCTEGIATICDRYLRPRGDRVDPLAWTDAPVPEYTGPADDINLLKLAFAEKSGRSTLGYSATFKELYTADVDALGRCYPDERGIRAYDASKADLALAEKLAFYTGNNCERIRELMLSSALNREKWTDRPDYLNDTIRRAAKWNKTVYNRAPKNTTKKVDVFDGCFYIASINRVLLPNGMLLKQIAFKTQYSGPWMTLDAERDKYTTNALRAFTENPAYMDQKICDFVFRPLEPFQAIIDGRINVYRPEYGARAPGDVTLFLDHIGKLLPDENDRNIFLDYLAACVQRAGTKFQWCVCLQGVPGNGKSLLYKILEYAIGEKYCHQASQSDLRDTKFNAWIQRKLLVAVEEIRVAGKREVADNLKSLITNTRIPIQAKGQDQTIGDNFANFVMFSNHIDAVLKSVNDRRYCVFFSAQQSEDDLTRDGMDSAYFHRLFDWLDSGGLAAVSEYLWTRSISIDVTGRAPMTTATAAALEEGLGVVEQGIMEAIDMGRPGFHEDYIVYKAAYDLAVEMGRRMSWKHVARMLIDLGYDKHPALAASKGCLKISGVLHKIYTRVKSESYHLDTVAAVRDDYLQKTESIDN